MAKENRKLRTRAGKVLETTKEKIGDAKEDVEDIVKKNPLASVVVAAVVGAVVALGVNAMVSGRRKKSFFDKWRY